MSAQAIPRAVVRTRRIDLRVVVGLLLFLVGVVATAGVMRQAQERTPVLIAARSLAPGETLRSSDLRVAEIGLAPGVATVSATAADALVGQMVTASVEEGQVLSPSAVADELPATEGKVALSVQVPPSHAAGAAIRSGDRVMLFATRDPGRPTASTTMLLSSVEVVAVETVESAGTQPALTITLAVLPQNAQRVVEAANAGVLDLVLVSRGGAG